MVSVSGSPGRKPPCLVITVIWGSTFLLIRMAMGHSGPMFFVGMRFILAAALAMLIFRKTGGE